MHNWIKLTIIFALPLLLCLGGCYQEDFKKWINTAHPIKGLSLAALLYLVWISTAFAFWIWSQGRKKENALLVQITQMGKLRQEDHRKHLQDIQKTENEVVEDLIKNMPYIEGVNLKLDRLLRIQKKRNASST